MKKKIIGFCEAFWTPETEKNRFLSQKKSKNWKTLQFLSMDYTVIMKLMNLFPLGLLMVKFLLAKGANEMLLLAKLQKCRNAEIQKCKNARVENIFVENRKVEK